MNIHQNQLRGTLEEPEINPKQIIETKAAEVNVPVRRVRAPPVVPEPPEPPAENQSKDEEGGAVVVVLKD